ncbi:hypothetical protein ACFLT4_04085 [Chloroflexota bacterium]
MAGKAESRLIYNSISTSERVASLGVNGALLFTWLITHCDTQGRMPGKPMVLKQQVVPFIDDISQEDVEAALMLMEKKKLIICYQDTKGRLLIQVVDWWDWQTGLRYKSASHYEAPEGWGDRVTPREQGRFSKEDTD